MELDATEATRQLFESYADTVYRFSCCVLPNPTEAEDAVQEIFMRAFRSWDTFQGRSDAKTWLLSIARNYLYDRLRKQQREKQLLHEVASEAKVDRQLGFHPDIEMEELLLKLKLSYRQVLILRYVQDMTTEEIAVSLGWSPAKVRTNLHRAVKTLRKFTQGNHPQSTSTAKGKVGATYGI